MARTKHTAKKTTGAPAPRLALGSLGLRSSATGLTLRQSSRATRFTTSAQVGPGVVEDGNNFCSGCRNGGVLRLCAKCPRVFCNGCVNVPSIDLDGRHFECPHCHIFSGENGSRAKPSPYPFTVLGGVTQRELYPLCNEAPLVIISIRLTSIPATGLPPAMVYHHLYSYLPGAIELYDLPFDFSTTKGTKKYRWLVEQIVNDLTVGRLTSSSMFAIYITNHTDPDRGDLHFAPNDQGATSVRDLVGTLLPDSLTDIIRDRNLGNNTLTFLACGALVNKTASRADLQEISSSGLFSWIMAFGQDNFQPYVCNLFLADVALHWFIQNRGPMTAIRNHQAIGAHTDIYLFYPDNAPSRLIWSHPGLRPFGQPSPTQCMGCQSLKPWKKPKRVCRGGEVVQYRLQCRYCLKDLEFHKLEGMTMIKETRESQTERGTWYIQVL